MGNAADGTRCGGGRRRGGARGRTLDRLAAALGALALTVLGPPVVPALDASAAAAEAADLRTEMRQPGLVLQAGGAPTTLVFAVVNDGPAAASAPVATVRLPLGDRGVRVTGSQPACTAAQGRLVLSCRLPALTPGASLDVTVTVAPPPAASLAPGERVTESGSVGVTNRAGGDPNPGNDSSPFAVQLSAEAPQDGITQVTGRVEDGTGAQPVPNATVVVTDSAGNTGRTATDEGGRFVYNAAAGAPLVPGRLTVTAFKDGFQESSTTVDASAGGVVQDVRIAVTAIPTTGAATPAPTAQAVDGGAAPGSSLLAVLLGSLLAVAGLAALGFWLYRHRNTESALTSGRSNQASHPTIRLHLDGLVGTPDDDPDSSDATMVLEPVRDATRVYDRPIPPRYRAPEDDIPPLPSAQGDDSRRGRRSGKGRHSAEGRRRGR